MALVACGGPSEPIPTAVPVEPTPKAAVTPEAAATPKPAATSTVAPTPKAAPTAEVAAPTQAAAPSAGGCATVADGQLGVARAVAYQDTLDSWRVIGLVCNKTPEAVQNVQLEVDLFDQGGNAIYRNQNVFAALNNIAAGEASPFGLSIYDPIGAPDQVKAAVTSSEKAVLKRATVDTQGVTTAIDDQGNLHITGELINHGDAPVEIHGLAAATFEKDGKMFTADYAGVLIHYLAPGASGPFRVSMFGPKSGATALDTYQLYFDAETTDPKEFLINAKADLKDLNPYLDANGQFHLVGEITNPGATNIGVRLLATVYDKDRHVIDASSLDTAISAIKPGEAIPFAFNYWGALGGKKGLSDAFASYEVQVDPTWTWTTEMELFDLKTQNDSTQWNEFQGTFTGEVINSTGGDLESAVIMVGIYAKQAQAGANPLLATNYAFADIKDKLADGQTAPYTVYVPIPKGFNIDNYEYRIVVKGKRP